MKRLRVTVEGKVYDVLVEMLDEDPPRAASAAAAQTTAAPVASAPPPAAPPVVNAHPPAGANDIVSPLAGKVVSIDVKAGQSVDAGTQVATIEAMKMNTHVFAPRAGRVSAVTANPGDAVEEGTVLLRLA